MSEKEEREEKEKSSPEEKLFEFLKQWPFMLSDFHSIVKQLQRRYDLCSSRYKAKTSFLTVILRRQESSRFSQDRNGNQCILLVKKTVMTFF